jgi:hypothetical protein
MRITYVDPKYAIIPEDSPDLAEDLDHGSHVLLRRRFEAELSGNLIVS